MNDFRPGIVITTIPEREENLILTLQHIMAMDDPEQVLVEVQVIYDGPVTVPIKANETVRCRVPTTFYSTTKKHEPGMEQPRNIGVRRLGNNCNAVWFVDSDILLVPEALTAMQERWEASDTERVIAAPYDWMGPGMRSIDRDYKDDLRWEMFNEARWDNLTSFSIEQINVGLGCFGGNLVWPIRSFMHVGGFWNDLHHGRCEDGELGVRAVEQGIPITLERRARGFHLHHDRNTALAVERNTRDVPMINERYPFLVGEGIFVVDHDGKRLDQKCPECGELVSTALYWSHSAECGV